MEERRVGRYRILQEQGRGGMGVLLKGCDDTLGRTVAIKLLLLERLEDPNALTRFKKEAIAISKLKHDHIASLYEFNEQPPEPFLAMEWIEGQSLEERLREGPVTVPQMLQIARQILAALDYAHSQRVIHRDIKPGNLMITAEGRLTIVDFGLAQFSSSEAHQTTTGPIYGTPLYIPPEMASGEAVDGRADLYSAALVFFEMLAGRPAFGPGTIMQIVSQQLHAPRPILSEFRPNLGTYLDEVFKKALQRDPADRYQTGAELLRALEGNDTQSPPVTEEIVRPGSGETKPVVEESVPVANQLTPNSAGSSAGLTIQASRKLSKPVLAAGCLMLPVGLGLSLFGLLVLLALAFPQDPSGTPSATSSPGGNISSASPSASVTPPVGTVSAPRESWAQAGGGPDQSNQLGGEFGRLTSVWKTSCKNKSTVVYSSGRLIVAGADEVLALAPESGQVLWKISQGGIPILTTRSTPGTLLLQQPFGWSAYSLGDGSRIWKYDLNDKKYKLLPTKERRGVMCPDESILCTNYGATLVTLDSETGEDAWKLESSQQFTDLQPVATDAGVYYATAGPRIKAIDLAAHAEIWQRTPPARPTSLALSPQGMLLVGCEDGQLTALSILSGKDAWNGVASCPSRVVGLACTTDHILVTGESGELVALDAGGVLQWQVQLGEPPAGPALTDGDQVLVATVSGKLICLDAAKGLDNWRQDLGSGCVAAPISVSNWVFVLHPDGVEALRAEKK